MGVTLTANAIRGFRISASDGMNVFRIGALQVTGIYIFSKFSNILVFQSGAKGDFNASPICFGATGLMGA